MNRKIQVHVYTSKADINDMYGTGINKHNLYINAVLPVYMNIKTLLMMFDTFSVDRRCITMMFDTFSVDRRCITMIFDTYR